MNDVINSVAATLQTDEYIKLNGEDMANRIMTECVRAAERGEKYSLLEVSTYVFKTSPDGILPCIYLDDEGLCIPQCRLCTLHNCYHYDT